MNPTEKQEEQKVLKKSKLPDMGSYNPTESIKSIQKKPGYSQKILQAPRGSYFEKDVKRSKHVPPPNQYKVEDSAFRALSRSPNSVRIRRH